MLLASSLKSLNLLGAAALLLLGLYCLRRHAPVAAFGLWLAAAWAAGDVIYLTEGTLPAKLFWMRARYPAIAFMPVAQLMVALELTNKRNWLTRGRLALLALVPSITWALSWTGDFHHLFRYDPVLVTGSLPVLSLSNGPWFHVHVVYTYALVVAAVGLLWRGRLGSDPFYHRQFSLAMAGILVPGIPALLFVAGVRPLGVYDPTPLALPLTGLCFAWGFFRHHLLDLAPIAHTAVVSQMADLLLVLDRQGRLVDFNPVAGRQLHLDRRVDIGAPGARLGGWAVVPAAGESVVHDICLGSAEGWRFYDLSVSPLLDGRHIAGHALVLHDITERRTAQALLHKHAEDLERRVEERTRELEQANVLLTQALDRLAEAARLKDDFVATISHELRTPLTNIKTYASLLERGKPERQGHYLATLQREIRSLQQLIEQLLRFSRLAGDMSEIESTPASVNINDLVRNLVAANRPRAQQNGLVLQIGLDAHLGTISTDASLLHEAITHLLTNALNYTPEGGTVCIETCGSEDGLRLTVRDSGRGMSEAELARIGERFFRGQAARDSCVPGAGLGLVVCRQFVDRLGGQFKAASRRGEGSEFTIWFPKYYSA